MRCAVYREVLNARRDRRFADDSRNSLRCFADLKRHYTREEVIDAKI